MRRASGATGSWPVGDELVIATTWRAGRQPEGQTLVLSDLRPWGTVGTRMVELADGIQRVHFDRPVHLLQRTVLDPQRGTLEARDQSVFIDRVHTAMQLVQPRVVRTADPDDSYRVLVASDAGTVETGRARSNTAARQLDALARRIRAGSDTEALEHWFHENQRGARTLVRELVQQARQRVLVVDAYFGAAEVSRYLLAVGGATVPIDILTSNRVLRDAKDGETEGDALAREVAQLRKLGVRNPYRVHVMDGQVGIHDRFLLVDDVVYLLGSSLNTLGQQGTMIVRLRRPELVRPEIEAIFNHA